MIPLLFTCVDKAKSLAYNPSQFWARHNIHNSMTTALHGM